MILNKQYILDNLREKEFPENGKFLVYPVKKGDIIYIQDEYDNITRIRRIDYFTNDWQEYIAKKSFYLTIRGNWDITFLRKRIRNSHLYIDINGIDYMEFSKYFIFNR